MTNPTKVQIAKFIADCIETYERMSAAEKYLFAFEIAGSVYMVTLDNIPHTWVKISKESGENGEHFTRVKPTDKEVTNLLNHPTLVKLGEYSAIYARYVERFKELKGTEPKRKNNGEAFECAIVERFTQTPWTFNNTPFTEAGDIRIKGVEYQIKSPCARYLSETNLKNLLNR